MHPGELACLLASSSAMSETIPPSLVLITIGSVTNVSIAALFTGGLLPAAVAALALVAVAWWRVAQRGHRRGAAAAGPRRPAQLRHRGARPDAALRHPLRRDERRRHRDRGVHRRRRLHACCSGVLVYRQFDWRRIYPMLVETVALTGAVMLIIGTATAMAWALTQSGFSQWLVQAMATVPGGAAGFLAITHGGVHRAGQRAGGHSGDRAVRTAAVPGGACDGRATRCITRSW